MNAQSNTPNLDHVRDLAALKLKLERIVNHVSFNDIIESNRRYYERTNTVPRKPLSAYGRTA